MVDDRTTGDRPAALFGTDAPMKPEYGSARQDLALGLTDWRMWGRMGWAEVRRRYRRTLIGPFWTSLSLSVFVLALGIVWSALWQQPLATFLPFLCAGLIVWTFVSTTIIESCSLFVSNESLIKQIRVHYSMLVSAVVWRNLIVFLHNLIVFVIVAIIFLPPINLNTLLVLPGLVLLALNLMWIAMLTGLFTTRFRDIQQLVTTLLQIALFVTPIFWTPDQLANHAVMVQMNVLFHLVDVVRAPLLGTAPAALSYVAVSLLAVVGWLVTFDLYSRFRRRVPYWL
jgi:ABC-type polysaccharide/polyol phosphate export permease